MIYLFAGDDTKTKLKNYDSFLESLPPETEFFYLDKNEFDQNQIKNFYAGGNLFFSKYAVILKNVFDNEEVADFLLEQMEFLNKSKNYFIFSEGKLEKNILDAFKKARAELNVFEMPKEKKEKFNSFLLADALEGRNKLDLWIFFQQAMKQDVSLEELVGVLFWKGKDMILRKNFRKFSEAELKNFCAKISYLLPEARKKGIDDELAFEQFLLEIF